MLHILIINKFINDFIDILDDLKLDGLIGFGFGDLTIQDRIKIKKNYFFNYNAFN